MPPDDEKLDLIQRENKTKAERRIRRDNEIRAILAQEKHIFGSRITAEHKNSIKSACRHLERVLEGLPFDPVTEDEKNVFEAYSLLTSIIN